MPIVYPGARLRLLNADYRPSKPLIAFNRANFHTTASASATSMFNYFNGPGKPSSHMHLDNAGGWEQYQYLDLQAEADRDGNDATVSVETQGSGNEPWTSRQCEELAKFFAWCVQNLGIQNKLAVSSKPGDESKGLSWHRLGVDGNFPSLPNIQAGRRQRGGGMYYSKAEGKVCPGNDRINQIPGIFARAQQLLGSSTSTPSVRKSDMYITRSANRPPTLVTPHGAFTLGEEEFVSLGLVGLTKTIINDREFDVAINAIERTKPNFSFDGHVTATAEVDVDAIARAVVNLQHQRLAD